MSDNTKNPEVSIIIPCYNVEEYLSECLLSLINQTFENIEIICVNDGSSDNTMNILKEFSEKDSRIIVINQKNSGVSAARNCGLKEAKGEFITFIDSDDWVDANYIEKLYDSAQRTGADIAAATIIRWRKNHQKYRVHYTEEKVCATLKDKIDICAVPKCCYIWNKLYKSGLVKDSNFKEGVYFEDMLWLPEILKKSGKLVTVPDTNYYYRANQNSIVKKRPSAKKQEDSYIAHKYIVDFFEENGLKLSKKSQIITKKIIYFLNVPIARIKTFGSWNTFYLFNLIPVFKYSKTRYRDFCKVLGLKFTIRKNKKSMEEIRKANEKYENGSVNLPKVFSKGETLERLINTECSMCRFGDGEFNLIWGESLPFQKHNLVLKKRLREILISNDEDIIVCIPDIFGALKQYTNDTADFWRNALYYSRTEIERILDIDKKYYDAFVSRPYLEVADKSVCKKYFEDFKKVWEGRNLVIVEGEASRLGFGNDLFSGAKSIKRIICPAKDAYDKYDDILAECKKQEKDVLFIIALGPTATVLAYDLAKSGYRALDLGHIDIEYEWLLMGVTEKVPVKNKYVNECRKGKVITQIDDKEYLSQIAANMIKD